MYRCTPVNPPLVNPPNSLIRQNYTERIHSHCKSTRLSANSPTAIRQNNFDSNLLIYYSLIRHLTKLLIKSVVILQFWRI